MTISIVSVKVENKNYIAEFVGSELKPIMQQATLHVSYAESSSVLSADFVPDKFDKYAAIITAKWDETTVKADDYFDVTLTGYEGEVTGMTPAEFFANKEIGTYTFTVSLKKTVQGNFKTDPETVTYKLTLARAKATLMGTLDDSLVYGTSVMPEFIATDGSGEDISAAVGRFINVHYDGIDGTQYDSDISPSDVGSYKLTASIVGHHDYYADPYEKEFTITARSVSFVTDIAGVSAKYDRNTEISSDGFIEKFGETTVTLTITLWRTCSTYPFR